MLKASTLGLCTTHGLGRSFGFQKHIPICLDFGARKHLRTAVYISRRIRTLPNPTEVHSISAGGSQGMSSAKVSSIAVKGEKEVKPSCTRESTEVAYIRNLPFPSSIRALRRRLMEKTGRTQLYFAVNRLPLDDPRHHAPIVDTNGEQKTCCGTGQHFGSHSLVKDGVLEQEKVGVQTGKTAGGGLSCQPPTFADTDQRADDEEDSNQTEAAQYLKILWKTQSADEAWYAYQNLLLLERSAVSSHSSSDGSVNQTSFINARHLTRLSSTFAKSRPRTKTLYLRYLSILSRLRKERGWVYLWEWNALINLAGRGWRKTGIDSYNAAIDVFNDMTQGAQLVDSQDARSDEQSRPDIITYTTLLNIAIRTRRPSAIRHAVSLLESSQLQYSRITQLIIARYKGEYGGISAFRAELQKLVEEGKLGIDGVNAFLWIAGKDGRIDVALTIYRAIQRYAKQVSTRTSDLQEQDVSEIALHEVQVEGLKLTKDIIPDEITYTTMIQILSYHGSLIDALQVFTDMLLTRIPGPEIRFFQPSLPILRALFCGFARHSRASKEVPGFSEEFSTRQHVWSWDILQVLLKTFLELGDDIQPDDRTVYWIMVAVKRVTSGDHDELQKVWTSLNDRFTIRTGGRLGKLAKTYSQVQKIQDPGQRRQVV